MFECTVDSCDEIFQNEHGMRVHRGHVHPDVLPHNNPDKLQRLFVDKDLDRIKIADKLDCGLNTIARKINQFDLEKPQNDPEILYEMRVEEGLSHRAMAEELGCCWMTISDNLHKHDIERD